MICSEIWFSNFQIITRHFLADHQPVYVDLAFNIRRLFNGKFLHLYRYWKRQRHLVT